MGRWGEWHGGESWGPRMMTDALPLLFLFLPEGFEAAAAARAACWRRSRSRSQALGAFAYDYRWERSTRGAPRRGAAELWDVADSPLVFYARGAS